MEKHNPNTLAEDHLYLIKQVLRAMNCRPNHENVSAAGLGLARAAIRFEPERGVKFETFAAVCIENTVLDSLKSRSRLVPTKDIENTVATSPKMNPENALFLKRERLRVRALMNRLPERDRAVVFERYFKGKTLVEIGKEMGVSRQRVEQIHSRAIERLKRLAQIKTNSHELQWQHTERSQSQGLSL